jgi:clan AA aspartic protease (TIGR02281 family)
MHSIHARALLPSPPALLLGKVTGKSLQNSISPAAINPFDLGGTPCPSGESAQQRRAGLFRVFDYFVHGLAQFLKDREAAEQDAPARINAALGQPPAAELNLPGCTANAPTAKSSEVDMVQEDGVLKVPVLVNGVITLKFLIDSGAAVVQIPGDVVLRLSGTDTVDTLDFLPKRDFVLADGSIVRNERFILHSLKVGDLTFKDIDASVGRPNSPLLLGQSFLSRFTEWKVNNRSRKLILIK